MTKMPGTRAHERHELELLRLLARGEKEIEAGTGYDLDAVFAEADALLEEMQRRESVPLLLLEQRSSSEFGKNVHTG